MEREIYDIYVTNVSIVKSSKAERTDRQATQDALFRAIMMKSNMHTGTDIRISSILKFWTWTLLETCDFRTTLHFNMVLLRILFRKLKNIQFEPMSKKIEAMEMESFDFDYD
ncbi:hypothetical protein BpHYR1_044376 [Brachionus plicatilis]|uniref:Uncharacterized protein n=1 Tax=Brachionus plicatilis TaxID=10195 RepID=A0A3M7Q963_BRAPC|nr:hypothetical protein BpHYR1_044376 [Brachionus plicatilis]